MRSRLGLIALLGLWAGMAHGEVPLPAPSPAPGMSWTAPQVERLRHWIAAAPDDALPVLPTAALDQAQRSGDRPASSAAASALALRLARMHLLGRALAAERSGWHIPDSDAAIDLPALLDAALSAGKLDEFLAGLRPTDPGYGALRQALPLEADPARRLTIARNMERWRWLPRRPGASYVLVNAAAFEARLERQGKPAATWRVIVGKPSTPTPVFAAMITGVTFNPWWDVPASIVRESVGALVRRSPSLARQRGYVWSGGRIRQRPGPGNSLGQVKLEMANPFSVYMHDTPNKLLFDREVRAFSHGCIRTRDIAGLAATLLGDGFSRAEAEARIAAGRTETVPLPAPVPVYVAYFTAGAGPDGRIAFYPDIYGRDGRIGGPQALAMADTGTAGPVASGGCGA